MKTLCILTIALLSLKVDLNAQKSSPGNIVFVMSSAQQLTLQSGKIYRTGVFLSEFYPVYKALSDSGYHIDLATPNGLKPCIDKESLNVKYWGGDSLLLQEAIQFTNSDSSFLHPLPLSHLLKNTKQYKGLIIPGGQGLMTDLMYAPELKLLLLNFLKNQSVIGLICHAPALLLSFPETDNPFKGYKITSVSGFEEWYIEHFVLKGKPSIRKIGRLLNKHGLIYRHGKAGKSYAIRDRNLISSQNPFSNNAFLHHYFTALTQPIQ